MSVATSGQSGQSPGSGGMAVHNDGDRSRPAGNRERAAGPSGSLAAMTVTAIRKRSAENVPHSNVRLRTGGRPRITIDPPLISC